MAHTDSVHGGDDNDTHQDVEFDGRTWSLLDNDPDDENCLGADDAAGIAIILHLLKNHPNMARYIIHRGEECGCLGSTEIQGHEAVAGIDWAISLDRKGTGDVIYQQSVGQTASLDFTDWLASQLCSLTENSWRSVEGVVTDSAHYFESVSECSNLSVGYQYAHGPAETLDESHVENLAKALPSVDWASAPKVRMP